MHNYIILLLIVSTISEAAMRRSPDLLDQVGTDRHQLAARKERNWLRLLGRPDGYAIFKTAIDAFVDDCDRADESDKALLIAQYNALIVAALNDPRCSTEYHILCTLSEVYPWLHRAEPTINIDALGLGKSDMHALEDGMGQLLGSRRIIPGRIEDCLTGDDETLTGVEEWFEELLAKFPAKHAREIGDFIRQKIMPRLKKECAAYAKAQKIISKIDSLEV